MTLENNAFDKKLVELNAQLAELQKTIKTVELARQEYIYDSTRRSFLLDNSIDMNEVGLEVHNGVYFIVAKDGTFDYVLRLTTAQAESLADDLDEQLNLQLKQKVNQVTVVQDMFGPLFKNIKIK